MSDMPEPPVQDWLAEVGCWANTTNRQLLACRVKLWALAYSRGEVEAALEDAFAAVRHSFDAAGIKAAPRPQSASRCRQSKRREIMLSDDARDLLDRIAHLLEPAALRAYEVASSPEEGIAFALRLSLAISAKRIADLLAEAAEQSHSVERRPGDLLGEDVGGIQN